MRNKIIFSVDQADKPKDTEEARKDAIAVLQVNHVPFYIAKGVYKGVEEQSYIVDTKYSWLAEFLADKYYQESILTLDAFSNAVLQFNSGKKLQLGKLVEKQAKPETDYTLVNGRYYAIA